MAFRDTPTSCVQCGIPMEAARTSTGHDLEVCDRCGGAWMDAAAFLADVHQAHPERRTDGLMEFNDGTARRPCPRCGDKMEIVWLEFLQLDQCEAHGVWFDPTELDKALHGDLVPPELGAALRHAAARERSKRGTSVATVGGLLALSR